LYTLNEDFIPEIYYDRRTCEPIVSYRRIKKEVYHEAKSFSGVEVTKRRVAWVQDMVKRGGAEISNELVIKVGIDCGNEIILVINFMDASEIRRILRESDLIIVNNIFHFSKEQMDEIKKILFTGKPYVKYDHDFRELMRPEFGKELLGRSVLNVFISPLHRDEYRRELGVDGICLPLAIDVDFFKPVPGVERKEKSVLAVRDGADIQWFIDENPDFRFTILSDRRIDLSGDKLKVIQEPPYEKMPEVYSEHEYFLYCRKDLGTGARVVFEAALCGCKVIMNEKVGHKSWGFNFEDVDGLRAILRKAPYEFWREIDRAIGI